MKGDFTEKNPRTTLCWSALFSFDINKIMLWLKLKQRKHHEHQLWEPLMVLHFGASGGSPFTLRR